MKTQAHKDGSYTYFSVISQTWTRGIPSDEEYAAMSADERAACGYTHEQQAASLKQAGDAADRYIESMERAKRANARKAAHKWDYRCGCCGAESHDEPRIIDSRWYCPGCVEAGI